MLTLQAALTATAALVALAFTLSLADRAASARLAAAGLWAGALGFVTASATAAWLAASVGWSPLTYEAFVVFGSVLAVPAVAAGALVRVAPGLQPLRVAGTAGLLAGAAAVVVLVGHVGGVLAPDTLPTPSEHLGMPARLAAGVVCAAAGAVVLGSVVVALARLVRSRGTGRAETEARRLAAGLLLVAAGTVALARLAGPLAPGLDSLSAAGVALLAASSVLFAGCLIATWAPAGSPATAPSPKDERTTTTPGRVPPPVPTPASGAAPDAALPRPWEEPAAPPPAAPAVTSTKPPPLPRPASTPVHLVRPWEEPDEEDPSEQDPGPPAAGH